MQSFNTHHQGLGHKDDDAHSKNIGRDPKFASSVLFSPQPVALSSDLSTCAHFAERLRNSTLMFTGSTRLSEATH